MNIESKDDNLTIFGKFCHSMQCDLPTDRIDQYMFNIQGFNQEIIIKTLYEIALNSRPRQLPSPNEILEKLIEYQKRIESKTGPKTINDLFGNKIRTETPMARELRNILKKVMYHEVNKEQALQLIEDTENKYGKIEELNIPLRKTPQQCIYDEGINEYTIKNAYSKKRYGENERLEFLKMHKALFRYGHCFLRVVNNKLQFLSMDNDIWKENYQLIMEYVK